MTTLILPSWESITRVEPKTSNFYIILLERGPTSGSSTKPNPLTGDKVLQVLVLT